MNSRCHATIVILVAIFVAAASASSETTKRLRTRTIYKSHTGSTRNSNISSNNQNDVNKVNANEHFLDIPVSKLKAEKQRQRQLIQNILQFGSLSIPIVSFSFSIHIPAVGAGPITVEPLETTPTVTEMPTADEGYDPSLGMESMSMSPMPTIMESMSMSMSITSPAPTPFQDNNAETMMCNLCPNGLAVSEDYILENAGGSTCGVALDYAATLEETSDQCAELKFSAFECCPTEPTVSCDFCKSSNGITVGEDTIIPYSDGATCGMAAMYAGQIEGNSEICTSFQLAESTCCPSTTGPVCEFCTATGVTVGDDFVIPSSDDTTCGMVGLYATTLTGGTEDCADVQITEAICCPSFEKSCSFCSSDGLTVDPNTPLSGDGATCETAYGYALTVSAEDPMCSTVQLAEDICCPVGVADSASMSMSMSSTWTYFPTLSPTKRSVVDTPPPVEDTPSPTPSPIGSAEAPNWTLSIPPTTEETPVTPPPVYDWRNVLTPPPTPPKSPSSRGVTVGLSSFVALIVGFAGLHYL